MRSRVAGSAAPVPRIAMVAGEASGDALAAHLIEALSEALPGARFVGIGGPKMQAMGFEAWHPAETLAVRGYVEVLRHLPQILTVRRDFIGRLLADPPDLFVGVDAPDFNLGVEQTLRRRGIRTVHYVVPQIWAWRGSRVHQMRRAADRVLALFPFEVPILEQAGIPVSYVGHPLADLLPDSPDRQGAREQFRVAGGQTIVALLPGSRVSELDYMGGLFIRTAQLIQRQIRNVHFLVPLQSRSTRARFEDALYRLQAQDLPLTILFGHAHLALTAADSVLLASGTATLEAALLKRPMVVTYRLSPMTYALIKRRGYRLPYVSLPNILAGRFVVPELLQRDATPENLCQAVVNQLTDKIARQRQERAFLELHRMLRQNTRQKVVEALVPLLARVGRHDPSRSAAPAGAPGI
jgi:lipid-A-disaccharide synthase